jgi:hypothetical protein
VAIAPDTTGSTSMTGGATSTTIDITAAAVGAAVYLWIGIGAAPTGTINITGWNDVFTQTEDGTTARYALKRRFKQSGDTTFSVSWVNSAKGTLSWASWTGVDTTTPDELATLATNGVTSRTAVPTSSQTPTASDRWAAAFFSVRTSTAGNKPISWTPDAALVERIDVDNNAAGSAPWFGHEIADSNGTVTAAAHSYTATHNANESHDASVILFLIPAAAATPPTTITTPRRDRRTITPRHTHIFSPPTNTPPLGGYTTATRRRPTLARRAKAFTPPPQVVVTPANPTYVRVTPAHRVPTKYLRRVRVFVPTTTSTSPPAQTSVRDRFKGFLRRSKITSPSTLQAVPPTTVQRRRLSFRKTRPTVFAFPPAQVVVPPTNPSITFVSLIRIRLGRIAKRGKSFQAPIDQLTLPGDIQRHRLFLRLRPRPTVVNPVPTQVVVPPTNPSITFVSLIRIRAGRMIRRGKVATPTPAQVVVTPNPNITFVSAIKIRTGRAIRRGKVSSPIPDQVFVAPTNPNITFVTLRKRLQTLLRRPKVTTLPAGGDLLPKNTTRRLLVRLLRNLKVRTTNPSTTPIPTPPPVKPPRRSFFSFFRKRKTTTKPTPPQVVIPNPPISFAEHPYRHFDKVFRHPHVFAPPWPQAIQTYPFIPDVTTTVQTGPYTTYVATQTVVTTVATGGGHEVTTTVVVTYVQTA